MLSKSDERMEIIRNCPIKVFSACGGGQSSRYFYPYKLESVTNSSADVRSSCLEYIVDSGISDPTVTNEEVIETATELNASCVIPKDYPHERARTTKSVREFLALYEESDCSAKPLIPLQPPHDEHYEALSEFSHYALGGLKNESPATQINAVERFREVAGPNVYVHALGFGGSLTFIKTVRENPRLVDSVDLSTHEMATLNNRLPDKTWEQHPFQFPQGNDSTTVRAAYAQAVLLQLNYMLSPDCEDKILNDSQGQPALSW
jgi:hypothetical protein